MSKKNFQVATTENGKTPKQDTKHVFATANVKKDKTPTGKVKTMKDKEELQKAREEQYKNFRINALKRRAKRMGLNDEQTAAKIEELKKQMESTTYYSMLIMFNPNDFNMVKQALMNDNIEWKLLVSSYGFIEGDNELLADLRKILPPSAKIYPYVKRKPPILPSPQPSGRGKKTRTKAEKKSLAAAAKKVRKAAKNLKTKEARKQQVILKHKEESNKKSRKAQKAKLLFDKRCQKAQKAGKGTIIPIKHKKRSTASKKASTGLKQAA